MLYYVILCYIMLYSGDIPVHHVCFLENHRTRWDAKPLSSSTIYNLNLYIYGIFQQGMFDCQRAHRKILSLSVDKTLHGSKSRTETRKKTLKDDKPFGEVCLVTSSQME